MYLNMTCADSRQTMEMYGQCRNKQFRNSLVAFALYVCMCGGFFSSPNVRLPKRIFFYVKTRNYLLVDS